MPLAHIVGKDKASDIVYVLSVKDYYDAPVVLSMIRFLSTITGPRPVSTNLRTRWPSEDLYFSAFGSCFVLVTCRLRGSLPSWSFLKTRPKTYFTITLLILVKVVRVDYVQDLTREVPCNWSRALYRRYSLRLYLSLPVRSRKLLPSSDQIVSYYPRYQRP